MAYADDDKEKVRAAVSILDLISAVTTVKRSGRAYMAVCPFHQEKTPSMSVDAARGLYYCHGCHAKGDIFTFVQETQGLTFPEALEALARQAGVTLTQDPEAAKRRGERERLVEAVRRAVETYHRILKLAAEAGPARAYLRSREYDATVVDQFKIGFAPGHDSLVKELRASGITDKAMVDAGLATRRGGRLVDYFIDRVLFPIYDVRGDPVGFGGRVLGDAKPKYLNTRDTRIYHKSKLLYGLDKARTAIGRQGYAVVVEGYTDVIALHRAGLPLAVASCGTALGEDHFDLLRRFADRIVLAFDADQAGAGAALRGDALETPFRLDLDLRVAIMPEGADPADLVQAGRVEDLRSAIVNAKPLLQFRLEKELEAFDPREPEARARALHVVAPLIARVGDEIARTEYVRFVAHRLGVDLDTVRRAVSGDRSVRHKTERRRPNARLSGPLRAERELLRAILANPGELREAGIDVELFADDDNRTAFRVIEPAWRAAEAGTPVPVPPDGPAADLLLGLALDDRPLEDSVAVLNRVEGYAVERRITQMRERLAGMGPDDEEYSGVFQELIRLERQKRERESE